MKKVTGIGGVFFKCKNVAAIKDWYRDNLGFQTSEWGASMVWGESGSEKICRTEWSPFKDESDYFAPSTLPYMINYRVEDLKTLISMLRADGITMAGELSEYDYGKFAHIMDPEGRKIELWEPVDDGLGDTPPAWTDKVTGLGGIFFKSDNPNAMKAWYEKHLGIKEGFIWRDLTTNRESHTAWGPVDSKDPYFESTNKPYRFNYRVRDIESLMKSLSERGIKTSDNIVNDSTGKFAWCVDPEGTKVDLWQP